MAAAYLIAGTGNTALQKQLTGYDPPSRGFGWNLYVGASSSGDWNKEDGDLFNEKISVLDSPSEIQAYFAKEGINRYRDMGAESVRHMLRKLTAWFSSEYMANEAVMQHEDSPFYSPNERNTYLTIIMLVDLPVLFLALIFCIWVLLSPVRGKIPELFVLVLYLTGSCLLLMVMETAPRYTVSFRGIFCVFAVYGIHGIYQRIKAAPHNIEAPN